MVTTSHTHKVYGDIKIWPIFSLLLCEILMRLFIMDVFAGHLGGRQDLQIGFR